MSQDNSVSVKATGDVTVISVGSVTLTIEGDAVTIKSDRPIQIKGNVVLDRPKRANTRSPYDLHANGGLARLKRKLLSR